MRTMIIAAAFVAVITITMNSSRRKHGGEGHGDGNFQWSGQVEPGQWVRIRNVNGGITVEPSTDGQVVVTAVKKVRGGNGRHVRFQSQQSGDGVVMCSMWGQGGRCTAEGYESGRSRQSWFQRMVNRHGDVNVSWTVRLPANVRIDAKNVNGGVKIDGVSSDVIANTVNGSIKAETFIGAIRATTTNGSIAVRVDSLVGEGDILLSTTNGSVTAELPEKLDAELDLSTVNGRFSTDYPVVVTGRLDPRHLRVRLGEGGRQLKLETVNGSVTLRRLSGGEGHAVAAHGGHDAEAIAEARAAAREAAAEGRRAADEARRAAEQIRREVRREAEAARREAARAADEARREAEAARREAARHRPPS